MRGCLVPVTHERKPRSTGCARTNHRAAPLARAFGFVPLPPAYLAFLLPATLLYLAAVSLVKARLFAKYDAVAT
ncbi:hypothetical protein BH11ARM2_BH11ARM2_32080 [soil metagenome]